MIFDVYNPYENQTVTTEYVSVIEKCLNLNGVQTQHIDVLEKNPENKNKGIIVIIPSAAIKAKRAGYGKIVLWVQGASAAESYMRHHSVARYVVLSGFEIVGLKCADLILFVSQTMKDYFEKKFKTKFPNSYIMPCFNNEIDEKYFYNEKKYNNNVFVYAGSLAAWQCFEPTVKFYKQIEEKVPNAFFRVLVKDHETAKKILDKYEVKNYSLGFVPQSEIGNEMAKAKFGFCLREESIVNRVATPTKLSTYIAHGVMPVYSSCLVDFERQAKDCEYCFCIDHNASEGAETIIKACNEKTDASDVLNVYRKFFGEYFSKAYHENTLSQIMKNVLFK